MYIVTVYENWYGKITESKYSFDNSQELEMFVQLCEEDGSLVFVKDEKQAS